MSEGFWAIEMADSLASACFFAVLGSVFGSFSSVLYHRIPLRLSVWTGRSRCPHCRYQLRAADLVPLLSYMFLRGRCRQCAGAIHWRYPLLEATCGLASGLAAFFVGWGAGLAAIAMWVASFSVVGLYHKGALAKERTGSSLVEVLVASFLFAAVAAPTLGAFRAQRQAELLARRRTVMVGLAREAVARAEVAVRSLPLGVVAEGSWQFDIYTVRYDAVPANAMSRIWDVLATVSCQTCNPAAAHQVKLSGVIIGDP